MIYKDPEFNDKAFTCPYCQTYSEQKWETKYLELWSNGYGLENNPRSNSSKTISISTCSACGKYHVWYDKKMIVPSNSPIPMPLDDMPDVVKSTYLEARDVYPVSTKSACALLRLALQHLCKELGEKGKNINEDIGSLVKKGLPPEIQKALDIVRVVGNNAVHPGVMSEEDTKEYATQMFKLLNFIVEDRIIRPKEIDTLFYGLPSGAIKGIQNRDK